MYRHVSTMSRAGRAAVNNCSTVQIEGAGRDGHVAGISTSTGAEFTSYRTRVDSTGQCTSKAEESFLDNFKWSFSGNRNLIGRDSDVSATSVALRGAIDSGTTNNFKPGSGHNNRSSISQSSQICVAQRVREQTGWTRTSSQGGQIVGVRREAICQREMIRCANADITSVPISYGLAAKRRPISKLHYASSD